MLGRWALVLAWLCLGAGAAFAQDLTLTSRDGALAVTGTLRAYDGEFYRIDSPYGLLTIDAASVLCDGPACPDLTAPLAIIRLVGDAEAGAALLPRLIGAFAKSKGLILEQGTPIRLRDPMTNSVLAEISFEPMAPDAARAALGDARAELAVARFAPKAAGARIVALDALIPIVAPGNPTPRISTTDLARALSGEVDNWSQIGGPDMPLVLHGLDADSDLAAAVAARLGKSAAVSVTHPDLTSLAAAVARDPWALAVTGRAGPARALPLTDSCGFTLQATALAVKAEDYPLTLPVYLLTPPRRLPLMAREFLDFLALPAAQTAISDAGYIARNPERMALATDGLRLMNAINGAGEETSLADLQRLAAAMSGADRLSLTFRFQDGSDELDAVSRENLTDLAQRLDAGLFDGSVMTLVGFSDGSGAAVQNQTLALARAQSVLDALTALLPDAAHLPAIDAHGEAMPMACDETAAGRRLNRRVEIWLRPKLD